MAVVIADAGPLIALAKVDALGLLEQLFGRVSVPNGVLTECLAKDGDDARAIGEAVDDRWLEVAAIKPRHPFPRTLGQGEIEAMQLAMDTDESLLIIDDQVARRYATRLGLRFIGTAHVLSLGQERRIIPDARSLLLEMIENGYRISVQ